MIAAEYTLTYADYKAAHRLYLRYRPWRLVPFATVGTLSAIAACLLIQTIWLMVAGKAAPPWAMPNLFLPYLWIALAYPLLYSMNLRRCYRITFPPGPEGIVPLAFDDQQISLSFPENIKVEYSWNSIVGSAEDRNGAIFLVDRKRFLIIPRRILDDPQWTELWELVAAKVGQRAT